MPHIGEWWDVINDTVRSTFMALLRDVEPTMPLLLLATSEVGHTHLSPEVQTQLLIFAGKGNSLLFGTPNTCQITENGSFASGGFIWTLLFQIKQLFNATSGEVITMHNPSDSQRREFFQDLLLNQIKKPPPSKKQAGRFCFFLSCKKTNCRKVLDRF